MSAMTDASKKIIMELLDEQITSLEEDTQAYSQLIVGAESIAEHVSLSIIEDMDRRWILAVVGVLGQMKQEAHLPYLKRVLSYSTPPSHGRYEKNYVRIHEHGTGRRTPALGGRPWTPRT